MFILSFKNGDNDPIRNSFGEYYMPSAEIKDFHYLNLIKWTFYKYKEIWELRFKFKMPSSVMKTLGVKLGNFPIFQFSMCISKRNSPEIPVLPHTEFHFDYV